MHQRWEIRKHNSLVGLKPSLGSSCEVKQTSLACRNVPEKLDLWSRILSVHRPWYFDIFVYLLTYMQRKLWLISNESLPWYICWLIIRYNLDSQERSLCSTYILIFWYICWHICRGNHDSPARSLCIDIFVDLEADNIYT